MPKISQEQINVDLFDEVKKLQNELQTFKDGVIDVKVFIDKHTGTIDKPRELTLFETTEIYEKLTDLLIGKYSK